jgi:hypothetical protein
MLQSLFWLDEVEGELGGGLAKTASPGIPSMIKQIKVLRKMHFKLIIYS